LIDWCLTSSEQFFSYIQNDHFKECAKGLLLVLSVNCIWSCRVILSESKNWHWYWKLSVSMMWNMLWCYR